MGTLPFSRKKTSSKQSSHSHSPDSFKKLKNSFKDKCKPFKFINTFSSGSHALQWCMSTATFMRVDRLLIACGSYISGDNKSLLTHLWSSAKKQTSMEESNARNFILRQNYTPLHFHISLGLKMNDSKHWRKTVWMKFIQDVFMQKWSRIQLKQWCWNLF